ncbi:MAG: hypothetical protein J2P37_34625 [Ktedonobacteraceae bacterium]|nr:hypothetical protein [Ktedonobacteraceae bacterium]
MPSTSKHRTSRNSLCHASGHSWRLSPSGNFRVCDREYCEAQQQRQDGEWIDAPTVRQRLARQRRMQHQQQLSLWSHHPGVEDPSLWSDPAEEYRAEQRYYRLIGREGRRTWR